MPLKRRGIMFFAAVVLLAVLIGVLAFPSPSTPVFHQVLMGFALYGYLFLVLTALTLPLIRELVQAFGKPFLTIHHTFAALGLAFITLHPILGAVESGASVFIPDFSSWLVFWALAGRPAFMIIYISVVAALLRKKAVAQWRPFHMLIYIALFFGIVHANLSGTSFYESTAITIIYDVLFAASIAVFVFKRYQNYLLKKKVQAKRQAAPTGR